VGFWVGASDIGWSLGQFFWTDGTRVNNGLWNGGAVPRKFNSTNNKTCVYLYPATSKLYHENCTDEMRSILCEVPPNYTSCLLNL
jgi:Lectin C-type domain